MIKVYKDIKEEFNNLSINDRLSVIFLLTGAVLAFAALIMGIILNATFWMNLPNLIIFLMCMIIPFMLKNNISGATVFLLVVVAYFYFPFIYFTNAGNEGAGPIYFIMIIVYFSFYMKRKRLIIITSSLILYYIGLMVIAYNNPDLVIPYNDELSGFIDLCVAIAMVSTVMSAVAYTSFTGYMRERKKTLKLNEELEKQNEILEELTVTDPLTEIFNRRYFTEKLKEEVIYYKENGISVYVMMIDVDYFKNVNDTYGHLYGDEVLKKIAAKIKDNVRSFDVVARYGGEEFVVLLANFDMTDVIKLAERIRLNVEAIEYRHGEQITISTGISKITDDDTATSLVKRADENMYKAKMAGRNKVVHDQAEDTYNKE